MHTSIEYTGCNLTDVKAMLLEHFSSDSFNVVKTRRDEGRIEVQAGDIYFQSGDVIHVKRTSILIDRVL
jgi:hypothetical protein